MFTLRNFLIGLFFAVVFCGQLFAELSTSIDYTILRPLPSTRLENSAQYTYGIRQTNKLITEIVGGGLIVAGLMSKQEGEINALIISGLANLLAYYVLDKYESPEEISWEKVEKISTEDIATREKIAAEELFYNAYRSKNVVLEGAYGLSVISTTIMGSYAFFSGYPIGALSFVGTYACFPKNERTEDQAKLLKKDIDSHTLSQIYQ